VDAEVSQLHQELALQRFDRARQHVARITERDRQKALLLQALVLFHKGRYNRSLDYLRKLEAQAYRHPELPACTARIQLAWGNPKGAEPHAREALEMDPGESAYRLLLATSLAESGEREAAIEVLGEIPDEDARVASLMLLGDLRRGQGETALARDAYLAAFERAPFSATPLRQLAALHIESGALEEGAAMLEDLAEVSELVRDEAFVEAARLYLLADNLPRLRGLVERRLTGGQADVEDLCWAARLLLAAGDRDAALGHLERAVALGRSPAQTAEIRQIEAVARWLDGREDEARMLLERSIEGNANPGPTLVNLAFLLLSRPNPPLGLVRSLLEQARVGGASAGELALHDVLILVKEGRAEKARDRFRSLLAEGLVDLRRTTR
jgi:tetratricopeptide (TPR) repeat protein